MPYYKPLKNLSASIRQRTIRNLQDLRQQLDAELPTKKSSESLILGTWNIRNFDDDRFYHGPRLEESFYYLAEILARFDVIAVQEICRDLRPLDKLMRLLGGGYDYILTDVTHRDVGGNDERRMEGLERIRLAVELEPEAQEAPLSGELVPEGDGDFGFGRNVDLLGQREETRDAKHDAV